MVFNRLKCFYLVGFFLILALPLLSLPPWFSPPDWGKTIVFRTVLSVLIFLFIYRFLSGKEKPEAGKTAKGGLYLLLAFWGIYFLATLFSFNPSFSFWGSPLRAGGFLNFSFYIIFGLLAFFVLKKEDWQKIWNFSFFIGVLVAIVAILQWRGFFENVLITYENRPPASVGNPIMLALYLLLLSFLALAWALKERFLLKKVFYFSSFFLFLFVILLTYSRAAYIGLAVGLIYFFFFYPFKKRSFSLILRVVLLAVVVAGTLGIYYINSQPEVPQFIQESKTLRGITGRLSLERAMQNSRISGWKVGWQALKDRPFLGYGPENFFIGFNKHYDPSLPEISKTSESWWDRAHNFALEVSLAAGIPALLIYLSLFVFLFRQLQKVKFKNESRKLIVNGLQATFLAYLTANFFSIDNFPTYLISFLAIGYAFYIIKESELAAEAPIQKKNWLTKLSKWKLPVLGLLFAAIIFFIWQYNIRPLRINKEINIAEILAENEKSELALERMNNVLEEKSILDSYLGFKYVEIANQYLKDKKPEESYLVIKKVQKVLQESVKDRPYYIRGLIWLGECDNMLQANWQEDTAKEAVEVLERALALSPQRKDAIPELVKAYGLTRNYEGLAEIYPKLIELEPDQPQHYASLAFVYRELGQIEKARQTALKIIELFPEQQKEAEEFLRTLP